MERPMSKTWPTPRSVIIGPTQRTAALNPFSHLSGESERFASFVPGKSVGKPGGNDDDHRALDHSRDALRHSLRRPSRRPAGGLANPVLPRVGTSGPIRSSPVLLLRASVSALKPPARLTWTSALARSVRTCGQSHPRGRALVASSAVAFGYDVRRLGPCRGPRSPRSRLPHRAPRGRRAA